MSNDIFSPDTNYSNSPIENLIEIINSIVPFDKELTMALIILLLQCQPSFADSSSFEYENSPVIVMTENNQMTTVTENNGLRMWNRLDELTKLKNGWDGENSVSIKEEIIFFIRDVISECDDKLLNDWIIFPDARGYLYLDYTSNKNFAGITVTDNKFVYFIKKNGKIEKNDNNILNKEELINIFRKVNG